MKKLAGSIALLSLILALLLPQLACAEPDDAVKGIFEVLTAAGSGYSQTKETYLEYYPETEYALSAAGGQASEPGFHGRLAVEAVSGPVPHRSAATKARLDPKKWSVSHDH